MVKEMKQTGWIWYPGDMELYHGMLQNFQREERGYGWPAYWKMDDWRKNVHFYKEYDLKEETKFTVHGEGVGYVTVNGKKYPLEEPVICPAGRHTVEVFIGNMTGLPSIYVEGNVIQSDSEWMADDFTEENPVGTSALYRELSRRPNQVYYEEELCLPERICEKNGGVLFDFQRMIFGTAEVILRESKGEEESESCGESECEETVNCRESECEGTGDSGESESGVTVCYGESDYEACDEVWCYYKQEHVQSGQRLRKRAFRYLYVPRITSDKISVKAYHQTLPLEVRAEFSCDNELMNRIWKVSAETYKLCSGMFFIDGIKRDRWIWSGDAYQSYFVNPYLFFDEEIDKRTILALRGNKEISQHINTIVDYSMLWLISVENEYQMTKDKRFLEMVYPKMESMMELFRSQTDENGFIRGRERDWIYIDWANIDKEGAVCAEQILLLKCCKTMIFCGNLLGKQVKAYEERQAFLEKQIKKFFWDEEKGAFIDSYESGKRNVTRHANIFAILFDLADKKEEQQIIDNVLLNPKIEQITTPYFKFFELDVWGKLGYLKNIWEALGDYWGSMLEKGAVTFWEEYVPKQEAPEQYSMYGDPFGKSLCHAWGASPIYLLGRYFLGVRPLTPGYETFAVEPHLEYFKELDCLVPVKNGAVRIKYKDGRLEVETDRDGGVLVLDGEEVALKKRDGKL